MIYKLYLLLFLLPGCPEQEKTGLLTKIFVEDGMASWYGPGFQGKPTASGEKFNMNRATAAHKQLEFGTFVTITNLDNGKKVKVRINDRGPWSKGKIIDISKYAAEKIEMIKAGFATVRIEICGYEQVSMQALNAHYLNILKIKQSH